jgi:hypothetical protein
MYIVKIKTLTEDIYKGFYSEPVNPYFVAYNHYKDGHSYMDEEEFNEYEEESENPELQGRNTGTDRIDDWGDTSNNNEFIVIPLLIVEYILQANKIEYDKSYFVDIKL